MKTSVAAILLLFLSSCEFLDRGGPEVCSAQKAHSEIAAPIDSPQMDSGFTNIQQSGVDESDFIKITDDFVFVAHHQKIEVIDRKNSQLVDTFNYDGTPKLFTHGNKIFASSQKANLTQVDALEINQNKLSHSSSVNIEGHIIESRKIGDQLAFITATHPHLKYNYAADAVAMPAPAENSSNCDNPSVEAIAYDQPALPYAPEYFIENVSLDNLAKSEKQKLEDYPYSFYFSQNYLYTISSTYNGYTSGSKISRYNLANPDASVKSIEIKGHIKDRWSLRELAENTLAVTTSSGSMWAGDMTNHFFNVSFENEPEIIGKTKDFGKNEDIRSVRFMNGMAYVVTFRKTDPLFAIDLSDHKNPKIAGELKIPGFSSYLHPLSDNQLAGLGFDTEDSDDFSLFQGVQFSLFDIEEATKMTRADVKIFGTRGDHSEAQNEPLAFMHDQNSKLIAFPLYVKSDHFSGLAIFEYDEALHEVGRIDHNEYSIAKCSDNPLYWWAVKIKSNDIRRSFVIDGKLWAISEYAVTTHDLDSLEKIESIDFNQKSCN